MLKRRHFLQLTGSTAAAIGLSQLDLARSAQLLRLKNSVKDSSFTEQ